MSSDIELLPFPEDSILLDSDFEEDNIDSIIEALKINLQEREIEDSIKIKEKFGKKIITAITVSSKDDVIKYKEYSDISDVILFDSKGYHKSESFDHNLLNEVPDEMDKMIAGNIQIDDIPSFKNKDFIIDLSGALEDENGKKDISKIDKLLNLSAKI